MSEKLPPAFDVQYYLENNPDLSLSSMEAAGHYSSAGRAEGRVASPLALRENLIALIDDGRSALEIGPFCQPLLTGANIAYMDVLDAEQLRARALEIGLDPSRCPEKIDYVGGLDRVARRFDAVISSHAIEHQPDLVHHLAEIERVLSPDGMFCLIIPDKRYCFDHYIAETTIAGVLQANRERRRSHSLESVIEHVALTTHNDPVRHWAGDHGPPVPPDRAERIRNAITSFDESAGNYIDVHAWYFTPDSFRSVVDGLTALGLTGLEVAEVYDTANGRNEFCAVLRMGADAQRRARERDRESEAAGADAASGAPANTSDVIVIQTADAFAYAPMLAITAPNVTEYCRRHGFGYESFIGVKRGFHNWQATFNRVPMLEEIAARGFSGWALYLDADAYIQDLDFDLSIYLADKSDRAAILAPAGPTSRHWDVNAGVVLVNLGHPLGRSLIAQWAERFATHSDDLLRESVKWMDVGNDQDLLHHILREDKALAEAVLIEPISLINGPYARFIRQQLRTLSSNFDDRLTTLSNNVAEIFERAGVPAPIASASSVRWADRLIHREGLVPALVEAPIPPTRPDLLPPIFDAWALAGVPAKTPFASRMASRDSANAAAELAALGKSPMAEGMMGGDRQHRRAQNALFAGRLARWTYDRLLSLAEAVGAVRLDNPEREDSSGHARRSPKRLYAAICNALGTDLRPPAHVGGHLGLAVGNGVILHIRMLDAIYTAWRLRQLGYAHGFGSDLRVVELGAGVGLTAFYAHRLGLSSYRLFDRPGLNAVQAYVLADAQPSLAGQPAGPFTIAPWGALSMIEPGSADLLLNTDSLSDMSPEVAVAHLREAKRIGIPHILSINHEANLPGTSPVHALVGQAGSYALAARQRYWLRAGYAEEHFVLTR